MTMDRRGFLYAGGFAAAVGAAPLGNDSHAAGRGVGSVTDFGVEPNADRDQTAALQKAIDELTRAGLGVGIPGGSYRAGKLNLPANCAVVGAMGSTVLSVETLVSSHQSGSVVSYSLSGLTFQEVGARSKVAQLSFEKAVVSVIACSFMGPGAAAINLKNCSGLLHGISVSTYGSAIAIAGDGGGAPFYAEGVIIDACRFSDCKVGVSVSDAQATITQNQFDGCGNGIVANGVSIVSGNILNRCKDYGLKLGSAKGDGHILAQSNLLRGCRIGIGVAASGDNIMASLNMITGAKDGAIRAFDGEKIVGPDLARQSAEAYLNLMVAGNVVR